MRQTRHERYVEKQLPRVVKILRTMLRDKNITTIERKDGWLCVEYKNGQIFKMRGAAVDELGL